MGQREFCRGAQLGEGDSAFPGQEGGRAGSRYSAVENETSCLREPGGGSGMWFGFPGRAGHQLHDSRKGVVKEEVMYFFRVQGILSLTFKDYCR